MYHLLLHKHKLGVQAIQNHCNSYLSVLSHYRGLPHVHKHYYVCMHSPTFTCSWCTHATLANSQVRDSLVNLVPGAPHTLSSPGGAPPKAGGMSCIQCMLRSNCKADQFVMGHQIIDRSSSCWPAFNYTKQTRLNDLKAGWTAYRSCRLNDLQAAQTTWKLYKLAEQTACVPNSMKAGQSIYKRMH